MPIELSPLLISDIDASHIQPLPCDRWVARSCLQKAIRRGEADVAVHALANLFLHDPSAVWRHLTIIALEDVGISNFDVLRRIVRAKRLHLAQRAPGLLFNTFVDLTKRMAASEHGQAICDLLMRVENDPNLAPRREYMLEASRSVWAKVIFDRSAAIEENAIAALCFGGFLDAPRPADPFAIFEICGEGREGSEVTELAKGAWKLSRNPMALLLPVIWHRSRDWSGSVVRNDRLAAAKSISGVPEYSFDQFTRTGKAAIRAFTGVDKDLKSMLLETAIPESQWPSVVGDLVFLVEGGLCVRRATWDQAEALRHPGRWLPVTALLGEAVHPMAEIVATKLRQLGQAREQLFHRSR